MIKFTNHQSNILNLCDKKTTTKKHKNTNVHYNFFNTRMHTAKQTLRNISKQ